jgi:sodium transport system permease protein
MLVRARRTVVMSVVLPALIMPIMLFGSRYSQTQRQNRLERATYRYAVAGPLSERVRAMIEGTRHEDAFLGFKLQEVQPKNVEDALKHDDIEFYIDTTAASDVEGRTAPDAQRKKERFRGVPLVQVFYRGSREISEHGSERMLVLLRAARERTSEAILIDRGFALKPGEVFTLDTRSVATNAEVTGSNIGRFITVCLVMLLFTGGSVAAMDIIAGEKERGTLETLLTSAASRISIVTAKQLAICTVAFVITLIQAVNFFFYIKLRLVELPRNFDLDLSGYAITSLILLFIPLAAMIAAILLIISAYAKTYKEAQLHFFPAYLLSIAPALASLLPGLKLRSAIALVPIANVSVATREILMNRAEPLMVGITFSVMTLVAILMMRFSARLLVREDVIAPANAEEAVFLGGEQLFRSRVLRWFAVMWAIVFILAASVPWFQQFQVQLLFNQIAIFLGASLLIIFLYKLDVKRTLSLRSVRWPVWIAIPIAVPSGYIATMGLLKVANLIVPAPAEMLRQFSNQVVPDNIPTWQLYLLVAALPAVCEEIAFRGILLHGLRNRFSPLMLSLVVGLGFGLFHYSLFRIAPTAFLGMILTGIAILTGSLFPGMLLHAGNNAFALWAGSNGFDFGALEWPQFAAAAGVFSLSLWIVYRNRSSLVLTKPAS